LIIVHGEKMKIFLKITILFVLLVSISGCFEENPTYIENYEINMHTEYFTLQPNFWVQDENSNFQWFQKYAVPVHKLYNPQNMAVLCYYRNRYGSWEALPSTRIFWNDAGEIYSDEIWFSHDADFVYIDYRNTIPTNPLPPQDPLLMKVVFIDNSVIKQ